MPREEEHRKVYQSKQFGSAKDALMNLVFVWKRNVLKSITQILTFLPKNDQKEDK